MAKGVPRLAQSIQWVFELASLISFTPSMVRVCVCVCVLRRLMLVLGVEPRCQCVWSKLLHTISIDSTPFHWKFSKQVRPCECVAIYRAPKPPFKYLASCKCHWTFWTWTAKPRLRPPFEVCLYLPATFPISPEPGFHSWLGATQHSWRNCHWSEALSKKSLAERNQSQDECSSDTLVDKQYKNGQIRKFLQDPFRWNAFSVHKLCRNFRIPCPFLYSGNGICTELHGTGIQSTGLLRHLWTERKNVVWCKDVS